MTTEEAKARLNLLGYDPASVLATKNGYAVWIDTVGNCRVKNLKDARFRGLTGAFYDNHTGKGETALQAALDAIPSE